MSNNIKEVSRRLTGELKGKQKIIAQAGVSAGEFLWARIQKQIRSGTRFGKVGYKWVEYKEHRLQRGHQIQYVDLIYDGNMLGSFSVKKIGLGSSAISFEISPSSKELEKVKQNQRRFRFLDLKLEDKEYLKRKIEQYLKGNII